MARTMHEKRPEEDNRYHDTWKLLKKYRDVTWSLEVSVRQVKNQFRIDYDCSIEDFLDSIYMAGADLGGTIIEDHAKCIERSYKMLTLLENAVNLLRTRHKNGEVYYWILYYSFLSPQKLKNVDEIIEVLRPHIRDISSSTYSLIQLNENCDFIRFCSLTEGKSISSHKLTPYLPLRFSHSISKYIKGNAVGIFLLNNGDIVISKNQKIMFVKRNLHWLNFSYEAFCSAISQKI